MNLLYCGDKNILDGLIISVLSILKNTNEQLHIYILTMKYKNEKKSYFPIKQNDIKKLEEEVKKKNKDNFIKLIDITHEVNKCMPTANLNTSFTPYCMLRLYADLLVEIPNKILYLDTDVVCLKNPDKFYNIDNSNYELVGVLDYYGCHFYKKDMLTKDYINSGVLLLNMKLIRENRLFEKCRTLCKNKKMLLPDQSALNTYCENKLIVSRIYNEQKQEDKNTVFRHFTTTFKFWPYFHTQSIKPWNIDKLHNTLNFHKIDDILDKYKDIKRRINNE